MRSIFLASLLFVATISVLAQPAVQPADQPVAPAAAANVAADQAKIRAELANQIAEMEAKLADAKAKMKAIEAEMNANIPNRPDKLARIMPPYAYSNAGNCILKATDQGLFVIGSGAVVKYDAKTLKPLGSLRLLNAPTLSNKKYIDRTPVATTNAMTAVQPGVVPAPTAPNNWAKYAKDNLRFSAVPVVIVDNKDLIIIICDKFFRVGIEKVNLIAAADMKVMKDANGVTTEVNNGGEVPTVQLVDNILYVMRGGNLWSLNAADGKELGQTKIPTDPNGNIAGGFGAPFATNIDAAFNIKW
ncbi:MAG: hypothetical protein WCJ56_07985 [bacterium]